MVGNSVQLSGGWNFLATILQLENFQILEKISVQLYDNRGWSESLGFFFFSNMTIIFNQLFGDQKFGWLEFSLRYFLRSPVGRKVGQIPFFFDQLWPVSDQFWLVRNRNISICVPRFPCLQYWSKSQLKLHQ